MIPFYLDMLGFLSCSYQCEATINALNTHQNRLNIYTHSAGRSRIYYLYLAQLITENRNNRPCKAENKLFFSAYVAYYVIYWGINNQQAALNKFNSSLQVTPSVSSMGLKAVQ